VSVYTCLADKTIAEIFSIAAPTQAPLNYFIPFPDEDFFSEDIVAEAYNLSGRYLRFKLKVKSKAMQFLTSWVKK